MQVEAFLLCDAANQYDGQVSLLGIFDELRVENVPYRQAHCAVLARIRFNRSEEGIRTLRLTLIDDDGREQGLKIEIKVPVRIPEGRHTTAINFILQADGLVVPDFKTYTFVLAVDNFPVAQTPLQVAPLKTKAKK